MEGQDSSVEVTLVGGSGLEESLRQAVADSGWTHVTLTGWQPPERVRQILDNAHVFVLPTYHNEGFPNPLLEAMVRGLPAISTRAGAIGESLIHGVNGFLIEARDPQALADTMEKFVARPELVREHSLAVLETVRARHIRETNCAQLVGALENC